jgi:HAD superfamily hydrolase (TIGR01509 family)
MKATLMPYQTNSLPSAVLWDMDGTLVDTEPHWMAAQRRLARDHDVEWTDADAHATVGKPMPVSAGMLQDSGIDRPVEQIIDILVDQVVDAISPRIPWLPGAERLLGDLADAGIPCALVTMASSPVAHRVAAAAPGNAIRAVIAGNDVTRGKPHPEPYLQAAAKLGVSPADCVAIEDSLNGTLSAEAAGIPVLVVPGIVSVPRAPGRTFTASLADVTVDTLRDLVVTAHSE